MCDCGKGCLLPSEVAAREAAAYKRGFDDGQAGLDGAVTAARRAGIEAGFDAGWEQGNDEAVAFDWGTRPTLSRDEALRRALLTEEGA